MSFYILRLIAHFHLQTLPDQQHCYFMTENKNMEGVLVCSIPFTHPAHVPQILVYLRQQALFNCLIASCVRPMARQDPEHTIILEVSALSWQHISVNVEYPYEETIATAELDLTDISTLKCRLYGVCMTTNTEQTSDLSGRVLQRCLSIPLTMRLLLKIWEGRSLPAVMNNLTSGSGSSNGSYNLNLGSGGKDQTGQNTSGTASGMPDFTNGETKVKQEPGLNNGSNGCMGGRQTQQQQQSSNQLQQQQQQQSFLDAGTENSIGFPSYSGQSDTTTMTVGTAGTNNTSASMLNPLQLGALLGQAKNSLTGNSNTNERGKKTRKRKTGTDGLWRSPKRKNDGGDNSTATEILLESSSSENSTPLGTPTGGRENFTSETRTSTPTSATSLTSGMDFSNLDTTDILDKSVSDYDLDNSERDSEIMEVQHGGAEQQQQQQPQQDVEDLIKMRESSSTRKSKKNRSSGGSEEKKSSPTNIFVDETSTTSSGNKGLPVPPSVSITPISCGNLDQASTTNYNSVLTGMGLERRPGIEIIPIASSPSQTNLPSSITITPIAGPAPSPKTSSLTSATEDRQRSERKSGGKSSGSSGKSSEDNKSGGNKLEKRRKRKREDSPMGPPDKVPSSGKQQQDPLSKPVSVSIKPSTEQSPPSGGSAGVSLSCSSSRPTSPAAVRKFSPSPTHSSSLATLVGKSSPTLKAGQSTATTCGKPVQSPKHSPVYGSSPKHNAPNVPVVPMSVPMSLSVSTVPNTVGNMPSVAVSVPVPVPASASPKHGNTSSPKHGSSAASSGKPSMSALKSAANSPSSKSSGSSSSDMTATPSKIKSSSSSSSGKDSSGRGDKERRTSSVSSSSGSGGGHQSPKTKSSSGKLKQLEIPPGGSETTQVSSLQASGGNTPPSGQIDAAKSAIAAQQARNRKSSLNAVIDKLKNAQHCTETDACGNGGGTVKGSGSSGLGSGNTGGMSSAGQKEKNISGGGSSSSGGKTIVEGGKSSCVTKNASVDTKNPAEYMVKHSSDGIKITINKTRTKDSKSTANLKLSSSGAMTAATSSSSSLSSVASSSSSSSSSNVIAGSNGSPKTHTGLKPGVNSGPASKKPQTLQSAQKLLPAKMMLATAGIKSTVSSSSATNTGGGANITATATGGVGGNSLSKSGLSSKASGSPKTSSGATDLSRSRDKPRIPKSSDKGIFASKGLSDARKSSPSSLQKEESESERAFKLLAAHASISSLPPSLPPQLVMEGLMKQLDTKFQIPKLSARANVADTADKNKSSDKLSILSDSAKQALDGLKQEQSKIAGLSNVTVSVSKSSLPDDQSRRDHSQNKSDNLSTTSAASAMSLNLVGENANLMLPPQSTVDSDVPTNLCIQPMIDNEPSRDSCKDLGMRQASSQQFLGKIDDTSAGGILSKSNVSDQSGAKSYATITGSNTATNTAPSVAESLNLSTKPSDQVALQTKYNKITVEEKKQQQTSSASLSSSSSTSSSSSLSSSSSSSSSLFSSLASVATTSDGNSSIVMTSDNGSGGNGGGGEQEVAAAEMLLDFSAANKDSMTKGSHSLPTSLTQHHLTTIPERAMTQAAPTVRRNTPPPPPPPPPPLPAPFPPAASPSVSVHIVKSPAPSPRVIPPSPHSSASPCITDDELMDEALVGMGK